jgi:endonuclease/exonuclease/phosphatase (EEP) superfamily protein YafD
MAPNRIGADPQGTCSLLVAKVRMENRDARRSLELCAIIGPEVVGVSVPDEWWTKQLQSLHDRYKHHVKQPQNNHYGINLYSRFPLSETQIHYFENTNTPSIYTLLQLPSGDEVILYSVHPRPPLPENSVSAADKELIKIAHHTREADRPVVVAGDFNDVPWSFTLEKFQEISQLRDIRIGRGLYNTFDAKSFIFRLPIDQIFISPGLGVVELAKPLAFSSDHKALFVKLTVDKSAY